MTINEEIAINLIRLRKKSGLSQIDLAEKTGLNRSTIIRIESASYNTSVETLDKICTALKIDITDLLDKT